MQYLLLIHQGTTPTPLDPEAWATLSEDEQQQIYADYQALNATPGVTPGHGLQPPETATTVRVRDGQTVVTDGPFADTKEALNGYLVLEADDLDAAIDIASRIPAARYGGGIEIRPVMQW
jgi:hypothetical protein